MIHSKCFTSLNETGIIEIPRRLRKLSGRLADEYTFYLSSNVTTESASVCQGERISLKRNGRLILFQKRVLYAIVCARKINSSLQLFILSSNICRVGIPAKFLIRPHLNFELARYRKSVARNLFGPRPAILPSSKRFTIKDKFFNVFLIEANRYYYTEKNKETLKTPSSCCTKDEGRLPNNLANHLKPVEVFFPTENWNHDNASICADVGK